MKKNTIILITLSLIFCNVGAVWAKDDEGKKLLQQYVHTLATDNSPSRQRDAFEKLSKFEPQTEDQVSFIFSAIKNNDRRVSFAAQKALANMKDEKFIPKIIESLRDKDKRIKVAAIWAVGNLKDRTAIPNLVQNLDEDEFITSQASLALAEIGEKSVIPELLSRIGRNNAPTSIGLAKFGLEALQAIKLKLSDTEKEDGTSNRFNTIRTIGFIKDINAVPSLRDLLKNKDSDVRLYAAMALINMQKLNISEAIQDNDASVRLRVISSLRKRKSSDVDINSMLIEILIHDKSEEVRILAANILAERRVYDAIPHLRKTAQERNKSLRQAAQTALEELSKKR
ncbi:MAG: HEAT repeat domain-containing protein [Candidatus Electronema sp. V4]|uniref:HEAT repeat domain-containing protein n=1 Tax=Candidatus Electronema sp. V4 TaxID=3454756 RepID=UPI0040555EAC